MAWYTNGKLVREFDPVKLHWVSNPPDDYSLIDLAYNEFEYLDLFHTKRDNAKIILRTKLLPRGIPLEFKDTDEHYFQLSIYCENEASVTEWFKLKYSTYKNEENKDVWIEMSELSKSEMKNLIAGKIPPPHRRPKSG